MHIHYFWEVHHLFRVLATSNGVAAMNISICGCGHSNCLHDQSTASIPVAFADITFWLKTSPSNAEIGRLLTLRNRQHVGFTVTKQFFEINAALPRNLGKSMLLFSFTIR